MLVSYEAIYDHGKIKWLSDAPTFEEAKVIITVLTTTEAPKRRGKPVAELRAPQEEFQQQAAAAAVKSLRAFGAANQAGEFSVAELIAEGRR